MNFSAFAHCRRKRYSETVVHSLGTHASLLLFLFVYLCAPLIANAQTYQLTYRATNYGQLSQPVAVHRIVEEASASGIKTQIWEYRLDLAREAGEVATIPLGGGHFVAPANPDSFRTLIAQVTSTKLAQSVSSHIAAGTGEVDTIAGLASHKYVISAGGADQYFVWIAEPPSGLSRHLELSTIEYSTRNTSFVAAEQIRQIIRLILLRGVEYPAGSGTSRTDLLLTRFDSAVNTESLLSRDKSFLFELESISAIE